MIQLEIPVKPHVKKFLHYKYGAMWTLSERDFLARQSIHLLTQDDKRMLAKKGLTESYTVYIGGHIVSAHGKIFTYNIYKINDLVDDYLRELIFSTALMVKFMSGNSYKCTLQQLLDNFEINEEDLKIDGILKDFQRKKEQFIFKKNIVFSENRKPSIGVVFPMA
jgi:hypothetical protein